MTTASWRIWASAVLAALLPLACTSPTSNTELPTLTESSSPTTKPTPESLPSATLPSPSLSLSATPIASLVELSWNSLPLQPDGYGVEISFDLFNWNDWQVVSPNRTETFVGG